MHYYQHHISDHRSETMHLSNEEDLAYRRLKDWYLENEKPIPLETQWVSRRLRVACDVVESVLNDFFLRTENGWTNGDLDAVIAKYQAEKAKNAINGSKGGRPKKQKEPEIGSVETQSKPTGFRVGCQSEPSCKPNHKPITNNHKPITNTHTTPSLSRELAQGDDLACVLSENRQIDSNKSLPSMAGAVCTLLKANGIADVNPSSQELRELLDAGVSMDLFVDAAQYAVSKSKGFAYALGYVRNKAQEAKNQAQSAIKSASKSMADGGPCPLTQQEWAKVRRLQSWEKSRSDGRQHPDLVLLREAGHNV